MSDIINSAPSNDLVSAKYACQVIGRTRATFYRLFHRQHVPPPAIWEPIMLWSKRQLKLSRAAEIQRDLETGTWLERDPESLRWKPLPNQYVRQLPKDAA